MTIPMNLSPQQSAVYEWAKAMGCVYHVGRRAWYYRGSEVTYWVESFLWASKTELFERLEKEAHYVTDAERWAADLGCTRGMFGDWDYQGCDVTDLVRTARSHSELLESLVEMEDDND